MTKRQQERVARILPNGKPRYIRCYDNAGETIDRYTAVFSGRYTHKTGGEHWALFMSNAPFSPQGVGCHSAGPDIADALPGRWGGVSIGRKHPNYGRRIHFDDLPDDCKKAVMQDYLYLWDLPGGENHPSAADPFEETPCSS